MIGRKMVAEHRGVRGTPPAWSIYVVTALVQFVATVGATAIYAMLATLYREFQAPATVGWVVTAYFLVCAVSAALFGRLGDLLGRRRMIVLVLGIAALGALGSALAPTLGGIIAGCALQGVAGALTPLAIGLAREWLPEDKALFAIGVITAAGTGGAGIAYIASGYVVDRYGFHGAFHFKTITALAGIVAVLALVPRSRPRRPDLGQIDFLRGILFAPAIAAILVAVTEAQRLGWGDPRVAGGLAAGLLLLGFWARHQARAATPLIDVRMLTNPRTAITNVAMIWVALGCIQLGQLLPLLMQQPPWTGVGFGLSAANSGWAMAGILTVAFIGGPAAGRAAARWGSLKVGQLSIALVMVAWLGLGLWHESGLLVGAGAFLAQLGFAFLFPAVYGLIVESVPMAQTSEATGLTAVFQNVFMAVGSQLLFLLLASRTVADAAHGPGVFPAGSAYTLAFLYVVMTCALCLATLLCMPARVPLIVVSPQA